MNENLTILFKFAAWIIFILLEKICMKITNYGIIISIPLWKCDWIDEKLMQAYRGLRRIEQSYSVHYYMRVYVHLWAYIYIFLSSDRPILLPTRIICLDAVCAIPDERRHDCKPTKKNKYFIYFVHDWNFQSNADGIYKNFPGDHAGASRSSDEIKANHGIGNVSPPHVRLPPLFSGRRSSAAGARWSRCCRRCVIPEVWVTHAWRMFLGETRKTSLLTNLQAPMDLSRYDRCKSVNSNTSAYRPNVVRVLFTVGRFAIIRRFKHVVC